MQVRVNQYRSLTPRAAAFAAICCISACTQQEDPERDKEKSDDTKLKRETFEPRIVADWPVAPDESRIEAGASKSYTAIATLRRQSGFATFKLLVTTVSEEEIRRHSAKGLIDNLALPGKESETSRRAVELSEKKYPALEITRTTKGAKGAPIFTREVLFMAGNRLVGLSVGGSEEAYIYGPEVDAFFKSLKIGD